MPKTGRHLAGQLRRSALEGRMTFEENATPHVSKKPRRNPVSRQAGDGGGNDLRPVIDITAGEMPRAVDQAELALIAYIAGPAIYQRGGRLERIPVMLQCIRHERRS
jgi:hypothetical protein